MEPFMTWLFQFLFCFLQYQVAASSSSPLSSFTSSAHPLCRHDQRSALLQFKHIFTIDSYASSHCDDLDRILSYAKTLSWDENATDCCMWDGVTCDGLTGHVIGLDLSCSKLYGKIHSKSSLFQLSHLQRLNLAFNDFKSSRISYAFGSFGSLTHLNLSDSGFSGSIPSEISHLSKLISLDLSSFQLRLEPLHFKVLLKNVTRLQELVLGGVNISSGLPDSLMNLSSLTTIDLSRTSLRGHLPDSVFHLPNLQILILSTNPLLGIDLPKSTWRSGSLLRVLDLSYTNLSGELPDSIGYLKSLNYLFLAGCKLQGSIPNSIGNLMQIRALDLSECKLQGSIPNSIGNLMQIRALVLSDNNFYGEVPSTLSNLKNLTLLRLHSNNFTGPIPFNLSGLQNLKALFLDHNSFSGVLPPSLFTLPSLKYLDLRSNHLTGQIPEFQNHLPLHYIDLSDNKLCGPIPKSISTLVNLYWLSLASNDLSAVVEIPILNNVEYPTLFNSNLSVVAGSHVNNTLPNLEYVFMSSCNIEVFPYFLRAAENLVLLDLSQYRIHGQIPNWVGFVGKASLARLNLSHNFLTGIKQLPWERLDFLDLRSNLLQGPLPILPPLTRYFFISNNSLSGEIPSSICNASSLNILDFSHNKLSGAVPQCLRNFSNDLSVLNLRSNGFKGTLPLVFAKPNQLRSLDLNGNQFEGPIPRSLANCTSLEVLDVGNNKINDTFPYWLDSLPKLQVLVIRYNRFHGPINTSKSKFFFPKLRIIDVSYNEFSGHLPVRYFNYFKAMKNKTMPGKKYMSDEESYYHDSVTVTIKGIDIEMLRILTIFTTIDFSSNNFSGEIPNVIGKLNSLIVLNISHNSLTGYIPESLGNLTSLESLDISSNNLTGRIPSQLASLTFLEVLNLSWNRLHGRIPQGPQFNTFQNGSYAGNLGLCGFPLSKECENNNRTKVEPPVLQQEEDDSDFDGFFWKIVVIGYGCGTTLGLFLGSLMFLIGRPKFFVRLAEREMPSRVTRLRTMVTDTVARRK